MEMKEDNFRRKKDNYRSKMKRSTKWRKHALEKQEFLFSLVFLTIFCYNCFYIRVDSPGFLRVSFHASSFFRPSDSAVTAVKRLLRL